MRTEFYANRTYITSKPSDARTLNCAIRTQLYSNCSFNRFFPSNSG